VLDVPVAELPPALDGLRIAHLSDFHLGLPSRGRHAVEAAVEWTRERRPDLVCVTGDLLSRRSGEPLLRRLLSELGQPYVVLGNHEYARSRDPFSQPAAFVELEGATLLADSSVAVEVAGVRIQIAGVDPRSYSLGVARPHLLADADAGLRVLLCHFPGVLRRLPRGAFHLVLAGHLHGGQICVPFPGGRLMLTHPRSRMRQGLYRDGDTVLHLSPGLGTTFVPFRFLARPEATELVLRRAPRGRSDRPEA
jgi:predicted MPP superfamily phosphohydrolase